MKHVCQSNKGDHIMSNFIQGHPNDVKHYTGSFMKVPILEFNCKTRGP